MRRRIKTPKDPVGYELAPPEVEQIVRDTIRRHHQELINAHIVPLFRTGTWKSQGYTIGGKATKAGGLSAFFARLANNWDSPEVYPILLNKSQWQTMSHDQRLALVDHELCHYTRNEKGQVIIVRHDVEEFRCILERHGFWTDSLRQFAEAATRAQQSMEFVEPKEPVPAD